MLAEVRKCAETKDINGLRYIFVDCLDVDPTFEKYKEDYNYCKNIPGFFDVHTNLNGIIVDSGRWNASYWDQLKLDLMKNFSKERFEHMIQVAKVVYASKIERLISERKSIKDAQDESAKTRRSLLQDTAAIKETVGENASTTSSNEPEKIPYAELQERRQERRLAEKRRELEEENKRIEAEQAAQKTRIESARINSEINNHIQTGNTEPKKVLGMVLVIIVIVIVVVAILIIKIMRQHHPLK